MNGVPEIRLRTVGDAPLREDREFALYLDLQRAGRDPNPYSGIFRCLGRYDRPWGPERPVFGKVRYMTSKNTARKHSVDGYIQKYDG